MSVKVCVVTSTRADYGILTPLLKRMHGDPDFDLTVAATGTHLLKTFGETIHEIIADGFESDRLTIMEDAPQDSVQVSGIMANALTVFSRYFIEKKFDLLLVLGDRYEIAAICAAAVNARLPIAHLHGGETTAGAIDECYRHAISKMSTLHFTSCEAYRRRVIQLGEHPSSVFNVGALGAENVLSIPNYPMERLSQEIALDLVARPYAVVTFHPVTQERGTALSQLRALMKAMDVRSDLNYLVTKSNADEDAALINEAWDEYALTRKNCSVVSSLGMRRYITALRNCRMMIGNSSSGIIEAPVCRVPTVNIGDRQKGRLSAASIVNCAPESEAILDAMSRAEEPVFRGQLAKMPCPYGDGTTSLQIVKIIKEQMRTALDLKKTFYDLDA